MKWLSEIFVVCLCLVVGGMWFSHQRQLEKIDRIHAALERHNVRLRVNNQSLLYDMWQEVEDEMRNQAKYDNQGMLDTLKYLNEQRDHLLDSPDLSAANAWKHISWMKEAFDRQLRMDTAEMAVISLDSLERITSPERTMELLLSERTLIDELNLRLGSPKCNFGSRVTITPIPIATEIPAGDSLRVRIQLSLRPEMSTHQYKHFRFYASYGTIRYIPGESHATLILPTDQVLKPGQQEGWLSYSATVTAPKITGGEETLPVEGKVKVIRRTDPMN